MNYENDFYQPYYPEDLIFDEKTQKFQKLTSQEKSNEKLKKNEKNTNLFNKNGIFNENLISKMIGGNELLSSVLSLNGLNESAKNNLLMQALSNFNTNKKDNSEKKIPIDDCDYFEEI